MKILTPSAHPDPESSCHAVLRQFGKGLEDAGHADEVVDLYAAGFDPVLRMRDLACRLPEENAPDAVEKVLRESVFAADAGLLRRPVAWSRFRNKSGLEAMALLKKGGAKGVRERQEKLARAPALVLISPAWFAGFAAVLKGWIDRVFAPGFAFSLTSAGWLGDMGGRIDLLKHEKALQGYLERAYQLGEAFS